jgi:glycosyltransferase involved in cell wall biosynthesis
MKISALIPTYNRRANTFRAIESVLAQTMPAAEIIVVDDGSTDGTGEAIEARFGTQVKLIRQQNRGVSAARSRGVESATCEWIAFLDSDDVWLPGKLEKQKQVLTSLGAEFGACFTNCGYGGNASLGCSVFEQGGLHLEAQSGPLTNPLRYIVGSNGRFAPSLMVQSLLIRRSLFLETGGFDEELGFSEDRDFTFRLSFKTKFCVVAEPLVVIDRTPGLPRLTDGLAHKNDQLYGWLELVLRKMLSENQGLESEAIATIQQELVNLYYAAAAERIRQGQLPGVWKNIRKLRDTGQSYPTITATLVRRAGKKIKTNLFPSN